MKIRSLHFHEVGPLGDQSIDFKNEWDGTVENLVLFTGPNGSGKSSILRMCAMLWEALGIWLDTRKALPQTKNPREWLQKWGGVAMILSDTPMMANEVGIIFGEALWCEKLKEQLPGIQWIGESVERTGKPGKPKRTLSIPTVDWLNSWSDARKKMILTFDKVDIPNMVFLDAEERRWVTPEKNIGEHVPETSRLRWLVRYQATKDWQGQLEASLINLKTVKLQKYHEVVRSLNTFLSGKEIDPDIKPGENRIRIKLTGQRGKSHSIDELSAGEHQVLIMIFLLSRWLEDGGIVLIDEPDLYLHPSLISGLLASLETLVSTKNGQLLITSHIPDVWNRYESKGKRVELGVLP